MEELEHQLDDNLQTADGSGGGQVAGEKPRQQGRVEGCNYAPSDGLSGATPATFLVLAVLDLHGCNNPEYRHQKELNARISSDRRSVFLYTAQGRRFW